MSYQNPINLYLQDCVETKKEPRIQWSHPTVEVVIGAMTMDWDVLAAVGMDAP
jgi:hypothetical protein